MSSDDARYPAWILRHMPSRDDLYKQRIAAGRLALRPLISIVTPVYNTQPNILRRMLYAVKNQSYPYWEHCLVDDGSTAHWIAPMLEQAASEDSRIRVHQRRENGGIVAASNDALALATGEFVAFLDHDDDLEPHALYAVARAINHRPAVDVLYSDLDMIGLDGVRRSPFFFPSWSPELLEGIPYVVHLRVFRASCIEAVGGFRPGFEGAQDYDLALRVADLTDTFVHIPDVLYHWRVGKGSAAGNPDEKPYAETAGIRAIEEHLRRRGIAAGREMAYGWGTHRLCFDPAPLPGVSIVAAVDEKAATADGRTVASLAASLANLTAQAGLQPVEVVVIAPADACTTVCVALEAAGIERPRVVAAPAACSPALALNHGAAQATHELLLLLGDDLEAVNDTWLSHLSGYANREGVGAVGPKVYDTDGTVAHAAIVMPGGRPHHLLRGSSGTHHGPRGQLRLAANYSAVSGACMMTRRATFLELGGLRPAEDVGYSDIDYCLRLRERGSRIVFAPHAELRLVRPLAGPPEEADAACLATFQRQWPSLPAVDPYYNPNYCQESGNCEIALD